MKGACHLSDRPDGRAETFVVSVENRNLDHFATNSHTKYRIS